MHVSACYSYKCMYGIMNIASWILFIFSFPETYTSHFLTHSLFKSRLLVYYFFCKTSVIIVSFLKWTTTPCIELYFGFKMENFYSIYFQSNIETILFNNSSKSPKFQVS